jgi:hypothetical protein
MFSFHTDQLIVLGNVYPLSVSVDKYYIIKFCQQQFVVVRISVKYMCNKNKNKLILKS